MFDVVCAVDVVVGTASISVRDCLKLRRRSVVRLRQSSGGDLDLAVHGVVVASGEVVVVDESTALRITHITQPPMSESQA